MAKIEIKTEREKKEEEEDMVLYNVHPKTAVTINKSSESSS